LPDDEERVRRERDLYASLLDLATAPDIETFLAGALELVVGVVGARRGYLELRHEGWRIGDRTFSIAKSLSDEEVADVRRAVSQGIVAAALATGKTISTSSAELDPRFADRKSVRDARIQAVLCAPIGQATPIGVVYLEGRSEPGPWQDADRAQAERFARYLAPLAERILARQQARDAADAVAPLRATMQLEGVVGSSAALAAVLRQAALAAPLDVTVLLTGDSGSGKTQLARLIHLNSRRAQGPFVELNCAALPDELLESELFGARQGAHSTATRPVLGKVAAAEAGTLFLDEIGELSRGAQAKLLQLLHSKQYYPLGSPEPVRADVRVIAATNIDLERAVAERLFRDDLFYRLQVMPIRLPSLAERPEDVAPLARQFLARATEEHALPRLELTPGAQRAIEAATWPGNARQLAHAVEAAAIRAAGEGAQAIEPRHVFPEARTELDADNSALTLQEATRRFQRDLLRRTLDETEWNVAEAARRLDIARSYAYKLIHALALERE